MRHPDDPIQPAAPGGSAAGVPVGNLSELVRAAAAAHPDQTALIWQQARLSWAELEAGVAAVAAGLTALALPASGGYPARVAVALANVPEFATAYFGILRAGLVAVPVNPGYTARELGQVLRDSGAEVLIGNPVALVAAASSGAAPARTYLVGSGSVAGAQPFADLITHPVGEPPAAGDAPGGEALALLIYTSGTEGDPKAAMLTHRALLANHEQVAALDPPPLGPDDVLLLGLPLFHAYGLNSGLGALAYHGATAVLVERFDPAETARLVEAHRVSVVVGVPTMYVAWSLLPDLDRSFAGVRLAISGAAPLEEGTGRRYREATGRRIFEGYGLTETAPALTSTLASPTPKPGSIGRPLPGVALKLVDASGAEVQWHADDFDDDASGSPGSDPGEIVARGANLFSGYWPDGRDGPDADGWWATGDVAYADADGDLFLVDRLRELILVSGFNVYPLEVEQVLEGHPAVAEAAVLGMPHPYTGQTVKAFVVTTAPVTVDELLAHCERNLARFKCPTAIE
ncbi:MAG TPA: AMP-binding protein, partial [Rugosimonospora sp.]|nr:AMP-binding protein [Rugosimonospora sp.]